MEVPPSAAGKGSMQGDFGNDRDEGIQARQQPNNGEGIHAIDTEPNPKTSCCVVA
jgi:hypothetical protein